MDIGISVRTAGTSKAVALKAALAQLDPKDADRLRARADAEAAPFSGSPTSSMNAETAWMGARCSRTPDTDHRSYQFAPEALVELRGAQSPRH